MIEELSAVVLEADLPEYGLRAGDIGVVMAHQSGQGYTVEFTTLSGETVAVVTLLASQAQPSRPNDIAHVREMATLS
jgi:hypothetical protein